MNSSKLGTNTSEVEVTNITQHGIWILCRARELFLSFEDFPWFKNAPVGQVLNVEEPSPNHYRWPDLDIDLGLKTIEHPEQYPMLARGRPTSWGALHQDSERLASEAQAALLNGRRAQARELFAQAADAEDKALGVLHPSKTRTIGVSAVSAASLYYKAANLARAAEVASHWLGFATLPGFAREQLHSLLQSIVAEQRQPMEVAEAREEYTVAKDAGGKKDGERAP